MKNVFSSYFANDEHRLKKLWQECIFVFDTNVYTSVYKRSDDARDAFFKIAESLGGRLWAPYQVVYEYLDNRAKITHDQSKIYAEAITDLQGLLQSYENTNMHPFLSADVYSDFKGVSEKVLMELEDRRRFHDGRITSDDIRDKLVVILDGKVGDKYSIEKLKEIIKEGEVRYANLDAPGFEDVVKHKGSNIFDHVCKRYGDLIIWKQVLEKAKAEEKSVIMVTEDQKDDWWSRVGGKTIGPLPELVEEFNLVTGQEFYLYSYYGFLSLANSYLGQDTSSAVIDEVRQAPYQPNFEEMLEGHESIDDSVDYLSDVSLLDVDSQSGWERFLNRVDDDHGYLIELDLILHRRIYEFEMGMRNSRAHLKRLSGIKSPEAYSKRRKYLARIESDTDKVRVLHEKLNVLSQYIERASR